MILLRKLRGRRSWRPVVSYSQPYAQVRWQSGDAADCKSANVGSIPARTSIDFSYLGRAFSTVENVRTQCGLAGQYLPGEGQHER